MVEDFQVIPTPHHTTRTNIQKDNPPHDKRERAIHNMARTAALTPFGAVSRPLLLVLGLLLLRAPPSAAKCTYGFNVRCDPDSLGFTARTTMRFTAEDPNGTGQEDYRARVVFYFGPGMEVRDAFFWMYLFPIFVLDLIDFASPAALAARTSLARFE